MFFDAYTLDADTARTTVDGYVVARAKAARTGIQQYLGYELCMGDAEAVYNVYRPKEAVMDRAFLESFAFKPVTDDHPSEPVTADNWRDLALGLVGDVVPDGEWIMPSMMLTDSALIRKVKAGKVEISVGYDAEIKQQDGVTADGVAYQFIQIPKRVNHIAIVDKARAGKEASFPVIADCVRDAVKQEYGRLSAATQEVEMSLTKIQVGDASFNVAEDDAAKLLGVIAAKDTEIGELKGEIAETAEKVLSEDQVWAKVAELLGLIDTAKKVIGDSFDGKGKSPIEIKKAVVAHRFGDVAVNEAASDAEIEGIFRVVDSAKVADNAMAKAIAKGVEIADAQKAINDASHNFVKRKAN